MRTNYEEQYRRQQQDYQRSRNPFEYGQQVARRKYSEIMAGLDAQRMSTQQSYGDLYQQARQRAVGARAAGGPTLSGGMGQQRRDYVSAIEMQELGKIGRDQQQAMADLYTQGQAAFSNAQLEGQQATQMELQNQQAALGVVKQKQDILGDSSLTIEEKTEQLAALGIEAGQEEVTEKTDFEIAIGKAGTGALIGLGILAAGAIAVAAIPALAVSGATAAWIGGAVLVGGAAGLIFA